MNNKVSAGALSVKATNVIGVVVEVSADGTYVQARSLEVYILTEQTAENVHIYEDAARMPILHVWSISNGKNKFPFSMWQWPQK